MIANWFKKIISKNRIDPTGNKEEQDINDLINFLWKQIDIPANATNLKAKAKIFDTYSLSKKKEFLPELYLLFEEHIVEKNIINQLSSKIIRDKIIERYAFLNTYENFYLIFQSSSEQELTLCRTFLFSVLVKSEELVGGNNDPKIVNIKNYLHTDYNFKTIDLIKERKKLLEYSTEIFQRIKNSLGINAITNIYLLIYKSYFQSYHLLDSFTGILNVIPEEILAKDLINFPSKQQMLKMLQKQLYSMEEINERLTKEIIERKKVEEDLKHIEHLNTTILETAMDGVILVNSNGTVLNWNNQAENILELKREETIGRSVYSLVPRKLRYALQNSFSNYIKTGTDELINKRVETSVNRINGTVVHIELTIIAIKTKEDFLFNAFFRDITSKKVIDNEIREAKVIAEKSAKAKSAFLSNMSHEIRTPLNVILGLTGILQKSDFSTPQVDKKNLDGIQFSAENLLVLINDILDFSKIEAGKLTLHNTDFNVLELIHNLSRGFRIKADEKGIDYTVDIAPEVPKFIIGDQLRLNQILINLLGNAIKFTHEGKVTIEITVGKILKNQITLNFAVKDTGVGIPKDKLASIFESFYQVHKPGKNKIEGTGLGLSISKQLIELQGGKLKAKSKPGIGSVFQFSIQYTKSQFKSTEKNQKRIISNQDTTDISGMRVLVVEDNKMNQFFLKQLLLNWNIEVHLAENGKIALEKIEHSVYDLILMDMHMPVMDGPETAMKIRKSPNAAIKQIPIIACSADVFPESKKKAIASGMDFYLTKPLSEKALEEVLFSLQPKGIKGRTSIKTEVSPVKNLVNSSSIKTCDLSFLKKTFDNDKEIIQSVLQIFIDETPLDYQKLKDAVYQNDMVTSKQIAHKLKSSFKTIGLSHQTQLLQKIEQNSAQNNDSKVILELFKQLEESFPQIIKDIKLSIKELDS
ncbi:hybrid sensor histidine kinase/response regulator [Aquimarina aggregata]|uniref:hybrid sensor histidine kinase/response regulator n=1 Tax=Aquimarina aggregata TaxID=1642818 RepID=UPI0024933D91|nr:ATP-binding protein [Aquimarina aggregata]